MGRAPAYAGASDYWRRRRCRRTGREGGRSKCGASRKSSGSAPVPRVRVSALQAAGDPVLNRWPGPHPGFHDRYPTSPARRPPRESACGELAGEFFHKKRLTLPAKPLRQANAVADVSRLEALRLLRTLEFPDARPFPAFSIDDSDEEILDAMVITRDRFSEYYLGAPQRRLRAVDAPARTHPVSLPGKQKGEWLHCVKCQAPPIPWSCK